MNSGNKDSESDFFTDFNETINKEEEKKVEKTGLNKDDDIPSINISKEGEKIIILNNPDNEIKENPSQKPTPNQKRDTVDTAIQTNFNPLFLKENENRNENEPIFIQTQNKFETSKTNKNFELNQKMTEKKYLGKKTKNNSSKSQKPTKIPSYNKGKLIQEKNKNNYSMKSKEKNNSIQSNVNKEICKYTDSNIRNNVNTYKLSFVNNSLNKANNNDNPNFIFNYTDIKRFVDIGLLKSIDEDKLNLLNTHDIHDYNDLFDLRNSHDFHEEQRIFQKNLNNYFGY